MSEVSHWSDCYHLHPACALAKIAMLEAELNRLKAETASRGGLTHAVVIPLHGPGPTWSHVNDEPPCR